MLTHTYREESWNVNLRLQCLPVVVTQEFWMLHRQVAQQQLLDSQKSSR